MRLPKYKFLASILGIFLFSANAQSAVITAIGAANQFGDNYSFALSIEDANFGMSVDGTGFHAILTNTSPDDNSPSGSMPEIDRLLFNLADPDPTLGSDFFIENVSPSWSFSAASGGILFDYVGDRTTPGTRIGPGETLQFDFDFVSLTDMTIFTTAESSSGAGTGGGGDVGQVAVSFQSLGLRGDDSDLIATDWTSDPPNILVPEPGMLVLFSLGLILLGSFIGGRKKR